LRTLSILEDDRRRQPERLDGVSRFDEVLDCFLRDLLFGVAIGSTTLPVALETVLDHRSVYLMIVHMDGKDPCRKSKGPALAGFGDG